MHQALADKPSHAARAARRAVMILEGRGEM
jgi:hypothetical protein